MADRCRGTRAQRIQHRPALNLSAGSRFRPGGFPLDVKRLLFERNNVIVAVSEGIRDASGNYISASEQSIDTFGHSQLSGAGKTLEFLVKEKLGVKVRSVEINVLQRCAAHLASQTDLDESFALGKKAVALSEEGVTASMVTIERTSNAPYTVDYPMRKSARSPTRQRAFRESGSTVPATTSNSLCSTILLR